MACVLCHWDRHVTWLWQGKPAWTAFGAGKAGMDGLWSAGHMHVTLAGKGLR